MPPLYSNPMRRLRETIKYNYISLITHSSAGTAAANKAFHCLTISYSLLFISFAFSHSGNIHLAFSLPPLIYNSSLWTELRLPCSFELHATLVININFRSATKKSAINCPSWQLRCYIFCLEQFKGSVYGLPFLCDLLVLKLHAWNFSLPLSVGINATKFAAIL